MKKTTIQYILALIACFVVGCGIALGLNAYDRHSERITPISGGQTRNRITHQSQKIF